MTPLGSIAAKGEKKSSGFLYNGYVELVGFRKEIAGLKKQEIRPELLTPLEDTPMAANDCISYVAGRWILNKMMDHLATMFEENSLITRLNRVRRDVAYGLDGWDILIDRWRRADANRRPVRARMRSRKLFSKRCGRSRIPPKERDPNYEIVEIGKRAEAPRVKMIREMHSWSNDMEDEN